MLILFFRLISYVFRSIELVPCEDEIDEEKKHILSALQMRANCMAVLRINKSVFSLNTQPVCIIDNEKDLFKALCDPAFANLNGKAIIVDDNCDLAAKVLRLLSGTKSQPLYLF